MASGVSSGIRRKVDDLGRVVIPAGIRRSLNIREGDTVEVSVDGERVVLSKPRDACVFCGREDEGLHSYRTRLICTECLHAVAAKDAESRAASASSETATSDPAGVDDTAPAGAGGTASVGAVGEGAVPTPRTTGTAPARATGGSATSAGGARAAHERGGDPSAPPERPASWPAGPIDGDALARALAERRNADDAPGSGGA